jgi:hypothetical protein
MPHDTTLQPTSGAQRMQLLSWLARRSRLSVEPFGRRNALACPGVHMRLRGGGARPSWGRGTSDFEMHAHTAQKSEARRDRLPRGRVAVRTHTFSPSGGSQQFVDRGQFRSVIIANRVMTFAGEQEFYNKREYECPHDEMLVARTAHQS